MTMIEFEGLLKNRLRLNVEGMLPGGGA
jgi:hypothetical protein